MQVPHTRYQFKRCATRIQTDRTKIWVLGCIVQNLVGMHHYAIASANAFILQLLQHVNNPCSGTCGFCKSTDNVKLQCIQSTIDSVHHLTLKTSEDKKNT
jgi:hypothetical protein